MAHMASAEAAVLHAILDDQEMEALTRLRDFLPGELAALETACRRMERLLAQVAAEQQAARRAAMTPEERILDILAGGY